MAGLCGRMSGRNILIWATRASVLMAPDWQGRTRVYDRFAMVGAASLRRPAAVFARPRAGDRSAGGSVRGPGFRRGRDRDPAGLARQRAASACLCDRADRGGRAAVVALPAHVARVRGEEIARGGRATL